MKRRVVITGMGAVTPVGNSVPEMWENIKNGVSGIDEITQFDTTNNKVKLAGEVKIDVSEYLEKADARKMDRFTQLAVIAGNEAFRDSGITSENTDLNRCGVIISSGIGGMSTIEREHSRGLERGFDKVSPFFIPTTISNMAAGYIAIKTGFKGYCCCPVTACAGGSYALGDAFRQVRHGYLDAVLCGGAEACITPLAVGGFTSMKALNETSDKNRASIPFDKERSGFVIGEGAGCLMLEDLEHALKRNAKIYGEVVGFGASCDAYHITAPSPDGEGAAKCMAEAIADAGLTSTDIDYINAHGTSTPMNDKCETNAIKEVFGDHAKKVAVSSTKSMTAHTLGAAGAIEGIICTLAVKDGFIPPTVHYQVPDEECDLDVVPNEGRKAEIKYAASNSLGFGGHNATVVFGRFDG